MSSTASCLTEIYVIAFTSGVSGGDADEHHNIEIQASGEVQHLQLYNRPGDDMLSNKGDLWKINFSSFGFVDSCITIGEIEKVYITENNDDGWHIQSIMTLVQDSESGIHVLTQDLGVNRWIDGDHPDITRRHLLLTFA